MYEAKLRDKVILVTGAGRGLGEQIALKLGSHGAIVAGCDIDEHAAERVTRLIRETGGRAVAYDMDVTDDGEVAAVLQSIRHDHGRIDTLINNAGIDATQSLDTITVAEWNRVIDVNLRAPFALAKAVYDEFRQRRQGHIINIASTAAKRAWTEASAYHASKWGLLGFSHALHAEARRYGVKVTAVVAGGMRTPFILERFPDTNPNALQDPANVADVIRYLLTLPDETVVPEIMILPMKETSWP